MGDNRYCLESYLGPSAMENLDDAAKPKLQFDMDTATL